MATNDSNLASAPHPSSTQNAQATNAPQPVNPMTATTAPQMPTNLHTFAFHGEENQSKSENSK